MSELAFDKEGNPFRFSRRTKRLRPRRWKNAGQRGTCAAVLDVDGEPVLIDADAEYTEFRTAIGNVPGFYRLDQCDEDGAPIEDVPPAYVSIESTRNAAPVGDVDPRDAIIRDLAQINADIVRTITERFGNVMQAAADILRAADGAGLPRREPPPPPPPTVDEDDEGEENDEDEDDEEIEPAPRPNPFGPFQPLIEMAMPHLPKFGAFMWLKFQEFMKQNATPPPATASPTPAPEPVATTTPAPAPSAAPAPTGFVSEASAPAPSAAPAPSGFASEVSAPGPVSVPTPMSSSTTAPPVPTPAASSAAEPSASAPAAVATISLSTPPGTAANESSMPDAPMPSTASAAPRPAGTTQGDGPRNAPPAVESTPEQSAHWLAIRTRLSPREGAIADIALTRMTPEMRAQWFTELSMLGVDHATDIVRSIIPKAPPRPPPAAGNSNDDANGGSCS